MVSAVLKTASESAAESSRVGMGPAPASLETSAPSLGGQRIVASSLSVASLLTAAAGGTLGAIAWSQRDQAKNLLPCTGACSAANDANDNAKRSAGISTGLFIGAGAALVVGAVLWFTAPSRQTPSAMATPGDGVLLGRF